MPVLAMIIALIIMSHQIWIGTHANSSLISVPDYWFEYADYANSEYKHNRILTLPAVGQPAFEFTSNSGQHPEIHAVLLNDRILSFSVGQLSHNHEILNMAYDSLRNNPDLFPITMKILGADRILLMHDLAEEYGYEDPDSLKPYLDAVGAIPTKQIGKLEEYRLVNIETDRIYASPSAHVVRNIEDNSLRGMISAAGMIPDNPVILDIDQSDGVGLTNKGEFQILSYERLAPYHYRINVHSDEAGWVVLTESYHTGWQLSDASAFGKNYKHFKVNGWANGWYIDRSGSFSLEAIFVPQISYIWLLTFSVFIFVILFLYVLNFRYLFSLIHLIHRTILGVMESKFAINTKKDKF